jgi:hypothetical protein
MALFDFPRTEKLRPLFARGVIALMLGGIVSTLAPQAEGRNERSGKPRVYNIIVKAGEPVDQLIRERYGRKYDVVEMGKDRTYVEPKLTKYRFPNPVYDDANMEVSGSVHVCFVVTADGRLVDPMILHSASPLLEGPVLEVLKEFRANPARLAGAPIAVVEVLKFTFGPAPRRRHIN